MLLFVLCLSFVCVHLFLFGVVCKLAAIPSLDRDGSIFLLNSTLITLFMVGSPEFYGYSSFFRRFVIPKVRLFRRFGDPKVCYSETRFVIPEVRYSENEIGFDIPKIK